MNEQSRIAPHDGDTSGHCGGNRTLLDGEGLPVYADDGTDLTVIRYMLSLTPDERLSWLETHMKAVASIRDENPGL